VEALEHCIDIGGKQHRRLDGSVVVELRNCVDGFVATAYKNKKWVMLLVLDRYCVSVSTHSLLYSIGEYDISVCVSPPITMRPLR